MRKNCSAVVIMNQLGITWYAGASVGVLVVCLLLIAEQNAHEICLIKGCLQIVRRLLWKQTTTHSIRNNNPMFDGNLLLNLYVRLSTLKYSQGVLLKLQTYSKSMVEICQEGRKVIMQMGCLLSGPTLWCCWDSATRNSL